MARVHTYNVLLDGMGWDGHSVRQKKVSVSNSSCSVLL